MDPLKSLDAHKKNRSANEQKQPHADKKIATETRFINIGQAGETEKKTKLKRQTSRESMKMNDYFVSNSSLNRLCFII